MAPKYIRTEEDLEDITISRYFILKSQATFPNFKKLISGCFCRVGKLPGVPTSIRQEFSKKLLNVKNREKKCESLFTF